MGFRRIAVITAAGLTAAAGGGAAIAATGGDGKKAEDKVLKDAAEELNVSPDKLRDALGDARAAQLDRELDRAVKAGELTQKQAGEIKARQRQSGRVLGFAAGPRHGPGPRLRFHGGGPAVGHRLGGGPLEDVAKALRISRAELFSQLRDGKTLAQIARAEGKSLDEVKRDVAAATESRVRKALDDGELTEKQAKAILDHLDDHLDRLGSGPVPGHGGPPGFPWRPDGMPRR